MLVKWSEIVEKYPDKWAFITDVEIHDGEIIECNLIKIVPYEDLSKTAYELHDKGLNFKYVRTTESNHASGVII